MTRFLLPIWEIYTQNTRLPASALIGDTVGIWESEPGIQGFHEKSDNEISVTSVKPPPVLHAYETNDQLYVVEYS